MLIFLWLRVVYQTSFSSIVFLAVLHLCVYLIVDIPQHTYSISLIPTNISKLFMMCILFGRAV